MTEYSPRTQTDLIGHEQAEAQLLQATSSGRLPHAWLITGAEGVAKAEPDRIKTIDATQDADKVAAAVWAEVQKKL